MANKILTSSVIAGESLRVLHNNLGLAKRVTRKYEQKYKEFGMQVGSVINVKLPNQYYYTKGQAIQIQNTVESTLPITLNAQGNIAFSFSDVELTLSIENFSRNYLSPIGSRIATGVDADGFTMANTAVFNQVGTPGTAPGSGTGGAGMLVYTAPDIILNAGVWLNHMACPRDGNRTVLYNPGAEMGIVKGLSGLFQDSKSISEQYITGTMGTALGFDFAMSQNVGYITTGTHAGSGTAVVAGGGQTGSSLLTSGWTASSAILNAGEIIQLAGVYAVNPDNQVTTGLLANFVVTGNVSSDANGNATIAISPAIVPSGATVANGTVTVSPTAGAAITLMSGAASTAFPINLAYHMDAFTLVTADLFKPQGADFMAQENYEGISMRIWRDRDINNGSMPCRVDVLYGWAPLRPQLATRIAG